MDVLQQNFLGHPVYQLQFLKLHFSPRGRGTCEDLDRDARVIFFLGGGLKFGHMLLFGWLEIGVIFCAFVKIDVIFGG